MRPELLPRLASLLRRLLVGVRGRRLLFVAVVAPGVSLAVTGAQVWQSPALLALGLMWILAAVAARRISEPRLLGRSPTPSSPSSRETTP